MVEKACTRCGRWLSLRAFRVDRDKTDGRTTRCRECMSELWHAWKSRNVEYERRRERLKAAQWRRENPERSRAQVQRRGAREASAPGGSFNPRRADYKARVAFYGGLCAYCRGPFQVLDHAIPLARGGTNHPANIRPACRRCNLRKHAKTPAEFLAWLSKNKPTHGRGRGSTGRTLGPRVRRRG